MIERLVNRTSSSRNGTVSGYAHPAYAESLNGFGIPTELPGSKGWILERPITGFDYCDAMGCYPIFVCQDWSQLSADLGRVGKSLVCLSLITDPFGAYDTTYLRQCFRDVVTPFKEHFVADLSRPFDEFVHPHHRRNARKALREVSIAECANPVTFLDEWTVLYGTLVERHRITGMAAFSRQSFARQLTVPGIVAFRAVHDDATVGMLLWYEQGDRAYYHLGAYSPLGYELGASFALFDYSIRYFAERHFQWLNLGARAGLETPEASGLSRFKQGWSTGTRTAYFCGRIFDRNKYQELVLAKNVPLTEYFPAYRMGEFN
jgi:hypothetical protein